jgi:hypothetical protein
MQKQFLVFKIKGPRLASRALRFVAVALFGVTAIVGDIVAE